MCDARDDEDFGQAWDAAPEAVRRSLGLAYEALGAGGLAVGSVLVDAAGSVLAEGRNQAYDTGAGNGPLRGTPLAHAELNALGSARTEWDLGVAVLWSTQEPCSMCSAAAAFTGVGAVRYLAPDPWTLATGNEGASSGTCVTGGVWLVAANAMFLKSVSEAAEAGEEEPATLARNRLLEPETARLHDGLPPGLPAFPSVRAWLSEAWPGIIEAAAARRLRTGG
ncbi:nucleoside deaminase [Streptomyces sp. MW-W600-10]|uniref:nucleoside deaminase n=1 Tax=Streptomyces sp. MW-W600-10 TaxID=2829819 RepID=UPI0027E3D511|nr:nucleoside deaminase [Streptomyces sp. MW-W600-10]